MLSEERFARDRHQVASRLTAMPTSAVLSTIQPVTSGGSISLRTAS